MPPPCWWAWALLALHFSAEDYRELVRVDPIRLIEAVVAAVGFLGAGAIFRRGSSGGVSGLTTAASLLMAAVVGIAAGLGTYVLAFGATVLLVLNLLERRMARRARAKRGGAASGSNESGDGDASNA